MDVFALLRHHLQPLCGGNTVHREEYADLRPFHIAEAFQRSLARIAGGGHEDEHLFVHAGLFHRAGHQPRQHLQRHVLEGVRRPMPKLQHEPAAHLFQRRGVAAEALRRIRTVNTLLQFFFRIIGQIRAQNLLGASGIGQIRHLFDAIRPNGRKLFRHIQATFVGEPRDDGLRRIHFSLGRARTYILHGRNSSSLGSRFVW